MFNQLSDEEFQEILESQDADRFEHIQVDWVSMAIFALACVAIVLCGAIFALMF